MSKKFLRNFQKSCDLRRKNRTYRAKGTVRASAALPEAVQELYHTDNRRWNEHDRVQYSVWVYALGCLFRPLPLEVKAEIQQVWRIVQQTDIVLCALVDYNKMEEFL